MNDFAKETFPVSLDNEMKKSYLDYAMSVIVGRALPDVRDGLKPVHRRVLYTMYEFPNSWNRPYKKAARIVGSITGKYHPHGEVAVYDALVRLAQEFSTRYTLVDGQGNFGSVDGDSPAAMRYTEVRMSKIAHELLFDIDKETVNFNPNYDGSEQEPEVLPSRIPTLLINGSSGIAVGMATNIPPHNLSEIINGILALLENENISIDELINFIPAPDFPTGGIIFGLEGVRKAYFTGKGVATIRGKTHIENFGTNNDREAIIIDEIPYQVNKAKLVERIGYLVRSKVLEGISDLRDESDRNGMRVVIELKRNENSEVILNQLFKLTPLQDSFGINIIALVKGKPCQLNIKQVLIEFLKHRREVVTRRTIYELRKARNRSHILEGLAIALSNVDEIVYLIKNSKNVSEAKAQLLAKPWKSSLVQNMLKGIDLTIIRPDDLSLDYGLKEGENYFLSDAQTQAILDLRLQRLTGLEQDKIISEYKELLDQIVYLISILDDKQKVNQIIKDELLAIQKEYGDVRKSEIDSLGGDLEYEDLIPKQEMVITLSHFGYIKSQPISDYHIQRRGGRGKLATSTKDDDFIKSLFIANTHDYLLCFTNFGRCYWIKVYRLPQGSRLSKGKPVNNILNLQEKESISAILPIGKFSSDEYIFMCTSKGYVKKTSLEAFSRPRSAGIFAINLDDDENLIGAEKTSGKDQIMLFSNAGKAVRFDEDNVRPMGRQSHGMRGMRLTKDGKVISLIVINPNKDNNRLVLTATENGFGKRTNIGLYRKCNRGGTGVIAINTGNRNGFLIGASLVSDNDDLMLITSGGVLIRTKIDQISETGRTAQGVKLINLQKNEKLVGIVKIMEHNLE